MSIQAGWWLDDDIAAVDWVAAKALLAVDNFDNGRSPAALHRSFEGSTHVTFAWAPAGLVGMARMLSDGVCNAYLLDVWTRSTMRRQGIGTGMVTRLQQQVPGQHIGLQVDAATPFYRSLGFRPQPEFMSLVVGRWLDNQANR
jgi:GNAT superfamily N-acetyltransferase